MNMRVAVASDDGIHVAAHAGRTRGYVIAEFENDQLVRSEYCTSSVSGHVGGGHRHGTHAHEHGDPARRHEHGCGHQHHHEHGAASMHAEKHAGIRAALTGCDVLISGGMGHRLMSDLREVGIDVLLTRETLVQEALKSWKAGARTVSESDFCRH
jgi:predicted Fe-Mo cluster-binding NifX family protein